MINTKEDFLRGGVLVMNAEEVFEKIKGIIVEQLGVAETAVTMEASFIEFDMEIPDADAEKVVTVGDVVDYIKDHIA